MAKKAGSRQPRAASDRSVTVALIVLAVLAVGVRLGIGLTHLDQVYRFPDSQGYRQLADHLLDGRGLTMTDFAGRENRAGRMPGYPLVLAALHGAFGPSAAPVVVTQSLLAVAAVWLAYLLGREVAGRAAGLVAAAMVALSPWQVYFATVALTECWTAVLLLATVFCCLRILRDGCWRWTVAAGLCAAALVYVHPQFLGLPLLLGAVAAIAPGRRQWLARWAVAVAVCAVAVAPWVVRNEKVLGRPVPATTRFGATLYDGVNPAATGGSDMRFERQLRGDTDALDELAYDAYYRRAAWRAIHDEPGRVLALVPAKLRRLWSPTPNLDEGQRALYRWASGLAYVPMMAGALLGVLVLVRRPGALALLAAPVVLVTAAAAVMVGSIRYRVPVEPMLFVLAGAAAAWVLRGSQAFDRSQE
ncbi:MAG: glycosyltransferase family 39 protein [Planctomycetes bacterium]|nr:glycosyltransferase family 39 protein [Planctomycetota bacterium]